MNIVNDYDYIQEYLIHKYNTVPQQVNIKNQTGDDIYNVLEELLNDSSIDKIYLASGDEYLQQFVKLSKNYKNKCNKISAILHRPLAYQVLDIASLYNRFIVLTINGFQKFTGLKNIDFLPLPTTTHIENRDKVLGEPVLTFCGTGTIELKDITHQHNRYDYYLTLTKASHNLPCTFLFNEEKLDTTELIKKRQQATHNVLFLDEWYASNASSAFLDSFTYLLPPIYIHNPQIEFYRNGLDIGFPCANAEQMLANVHYAVVNFDNNRYIQQINNLKFIREYFSGKALAQRYSV